MRVFCKNCGEPFERDQPWKTYCIPCFIKIKKAQDEPQEVIVQRVHIPDEMLMRIIRLCHPDRHNNSAASNEATKYLLELREESRGGA